MFIFFTLGIIYSTLPIYNFPDTGLLTTLEKRGCEHLARYQKSNAWLTTNQEALAITLSKYINYFNCKREKILFFIFCSLVCMNTTHSKCNHIFLFCYSTDEE